MKTYYIRVTESLVKTVEVHAENEQEALQKEAFDMLDITAEDQEKMKRCLLLQPRHT